MWTFYALKIISSSALPNTGTTIPSYYTTSVPQKALIPVQCVPAQITTFISYLHVSEVSIETQFTVHRVERTTAAQVNMCRHMLGQCVCDLAVHQ